MGFEARGQVKRAAIRAVDERQAGHLGGADVAARRAGRLAAELLSLARRQAAADAVLDPNDVVQAFTDTLGQVTGGKVRLRLDLAPEPGRACLDVEQVELVHVWAYDFVEDRPRDGRKFRMLNVVV